MKKGGRNVSWRETLSSQSQSIDNRSNPDLWPKSSARISVSMCSYGERKRTRVPLRPNVMVREPLFRE